MEIVILFAVAVILYLVFDNRKVVDQMREETNPALKAQKGCGVGVGWLVVGMLLLWLLLGSVVGFTELNVGVTEDGVTLTQPHDPDNPMTRPIGELLGVR